MKRLLCVRIWFVAACSSDDGDDDANPVCGNLFTTRAVQDTLTPSWNQATSPTPVPGGTVLFIDVYDEDLAADDLAWACQANPLTADFLRGGAITCQGSALPGSNVIVDVRPN